MKPVIADEQLTYLASKRDYYRDIKNYDQPKNLYVITT
jgi:hypothetical protein